ncbi:gamma-butyrobetaine hydroxylase-like domain-containing protein [Bradyrhizobium oligotrophicum S58]
MTDVEVADGEVSADLSSLLLRSASGAAPGLISAERLRLSCMCAHCKRARLDGRFPAQFPGIGIVGVSDLGYGLNIAFSDGHNRGIYPKSYLWELAAD